MRTLLIGHPGVTWRGWLKENRGPNSLIALDPADSRQPRPGQLTRFNGSVPDAWRFYGSLDPVRAPHLLIAATVRLLQAAGDDVIIQAPAYRPGPMARSISLLLAEVVDPGRILIADGAELSHDGFAIGPETVALEAAFPPLVESAQRKARWMGFIESATEQELSLNRISIEGARLGSGRSIPVAELERFLPGAVHAEVSGAALFVITSDPFPDDDAARALNSFHASRIHTALEADYDDLVCGLARGTGEDFAFGIVRKLDFRRGLVTIQSDAIPPAPATIFRLGALRVDVKGNERGETRPWTL